MNFIPLLLKLERSQEFQDFKEKNPDAFPCAGFFIRDFKEGNNQTSIDFCNNQEIYTFTPQTKEQSFQITKEEILDKTKPLLPFNTDIEVDLDQLKPIIEAELKKNKIEKQLEKIIAVLQAHEEKTIWNLTCFVEGMKIITIHINSITKEILKFDERSLFDYVRPMKK